MGIVIRPFDGSRADAEGILRIEQATFNESPYAAAEVQAMLVRGPQQAWLAVEGSRAIGFVTAFLTYGTGGATWEIDLLAVHPERRGWRLGSRLIRAAASEGAALARRARAVVADDNHASAQAFLRLGFRALPGIFDLLIERPQERESRLRPAESVNVMEAPQGGEVGARLADLPHCDPRWEPSPECQSRSWAQGEGEIGRGSTLLVAEQGGRLLGHAEVVAVQTLLYQGVWIESLRVRSRLAREALLAYAVARVRAAGWDEIGALVPERNRPLIRALRAAGFRSLGKFHSLTAELPLADPSPAESCPRGRAPGIRRD